MKLDLPRTRRSLKQHDIAAWVLADFRNRDPFSRRILGLPDTLHCTRRWYYVIPAIGAPIKIVSAVEPHLLDDLSGSTCLYRTWQDLVGVLRKVLGRSRQHIAMQYSPKNRIPYLSTVDAGTVELFRSLGHEVVSSSVLLHQALSYIGPAGYRSHKTAARLVDQIRRSAFAKIETALEMGKRITELEVQQFIMRRFAAEGLVTADPPMVGVNEHPADPHFEVSKTQPAIIRKGDTILIDLWAKLRSVNSIYYDITWVGYAGSKPPPQYQKIWAIVRDARDAAIEFVLNRARRSLPCTGAAVDDVARRVIERAGFGRYFVHRTGHNITTSTHGEGTNIDNFETADDRLLLPGSCFSIEPGIYLPRKMAVRSEVNMFIHDDGAAEVTGEIQRDLVLLG
jgi:Xaa-Pro dipeptidase